MHYSVIATIVTIFELALVGAVPLGPLGPQTSELETFGAQVSETGLYESMTVSTTPTAAAVPAESNSGSSGAASTTVTSTKTPAIITGAPDTNPSLRSFISQAERTKTASQPPISIEQQFIQGPPGPINPDSIHSVGRWPYAPSGWRHKREE